MNPLFAKQANTTQNTEEQQVEQPEYTVLIIDDEAEVHRVTELTLKRFRFEGHAFLGACYTLIVSFRIHHNVRLADHLGQMLRLLSVGSVCRDPCRCKQQRRPL